MDKHETLMHQYESNEARDRTGKLEAWLLQASEQFDLQEQEWRCLMDCLTGTIYQQEFMLQPGVMEAQIEDIVAYEPGRFNRWGLVAAELLGKIRPMTTFQRLALYFRIDWLFDNSSAVD